MKCAPKSLVFYGFTVSDSFPLIIILVIFCMVIQTKMDILDRRKLTNQNTRHEYICRHTTMNSNVRKDQLNFLNTLQCDLISLRKYKYNYDIYWPKN